MIKYKFFYCFLLFVWSFDTQTKELQASANFNFFEKHTPIPNFVSTSIFSKNEKFENINLQNLAHSIPKLGHFDIRSLENSGRFEVVQDYYLIEKNDQQKIQQLPTLKFDFVRVGQYLVPNKRSVQRSDHPRWEWQVSPGQFWNQDGDKGFARIVFPFSLQEKNANCTHNGLLLFLLNNKGETTKGIFQIGSETCPYFQFDQVGRVAVDYHSNKNTNLDAVENLFQKELKHKSVIKTPLDLVEDYPNVDLGKLLPDDLSSSTTSGIIIDGAHYSLNCGTRYGYYPYCRWLALPSYSTAKSIFAGVGLMRLRALIPNVENILVTKIIPECSIEKWKNVTLGDLVNMRTGNYLSSTAHGDEASKRMINFLTRSTHQERLTKACDMFPQKARPGKYFKYHTSDSYLAGVMFDRILKKVSGQTDFYQSMLVEDLWEKMSLSPLLNESKRSYDKDKQTLTGWGLTYYADDIIKIVNFLNQQKRLTQEKSLLDLELLKSALQYGDLRINRSGGDIHMAYNNGFWGLEVSADIGCKLPKWIPFMSGFGGITVAMISDNIIYYNFSDNYKFSWLKVVKALSQQFSVCEANEL